MPSSKSDTKPVLVSREPWWAYPPRPGQSELEVEWGYLETYDDGTLRFVRERPSDEEILNRKSCRL
ncbi:MAG TPA: hypothetical protein ENJ91_10910 [Rhodobacteraceae bacterium]|nr:hypothetical protein [Paracoccaceae bacterium]